LSEERYRRWVLEYLEAWNDRIQANDGGTSLGYTEQAYDELGQATSIKEAAGTVDISTTAMEYDALGQAKTVTTGTESGAAQTTVTRYDVGGRAIEVDDEFACTTATYDYRDLATSRIEGRAAGNPCTGTGSRTVNDTYDGLGRRTAVHDPDLGDWSYVYDTSGRLIGESEPGGAFLREYLYLGDIPVGIVQ
jgi:YD repeat-containing protein